MGAGKGLTYQLFSASGTFTVPAGVTNVFLIGMGGGAGGYSGGLTSSSRPSGGAASVPRMIVKPVTPNTTYTVTIGAGGLGASGGIGVNVQAGAAGGTTTFGSLATFSGAVNVNEVSTQMLNPVAFPINNQAGNFYGEPGYGIGNSYSFPRGTNGITDYIGIGNGGVGGAGGWSGPGGTGGNGGDPLGVGQPASAGNYGAGGGGGGSRNVGGNPSTAGGNGAGGALWVCWLEGASNLTSKTFTTNGTWVCPGGVTSVLALGQGGGGGGEISYSTLRRGGCGGISTYLVPLMVDVIPGTSYAVTVGNGGTSMTAGGDTSLGSTRVWKGGPSGAVNNAGYTVGYTQGRNVNFSNTLPIPARPASDGAALQFQYSLCEGTVGASGSPGGTFGSTPSDASGGAPGNSSDVGIGGNGGNGANNTAGTNAAAGQNASPTHYGAGGGGAGGTTTTRPTPNIGGNGAGGRLIIMWAE